MSVQKNWSTPLVALFASLLTVVSSQDLFTYNEHQQGGQNSNSSHFITFYRLENSAKSGNFSNIGFMIVAPSIIQPDSIYSAVVTMGDEMGLPGVNVKLSLFKDGADIQGDSQVISAGTSDLLKILVPLRLTPGDYKIRVEGSHINQGGIIFEAESPLKFSEKFLSILIQTNRYIYTGSQTIRFRVIMLKRNLLPYTEPVDVYLLDSRELIMRRWLSVFSSQGVSNLEYELPEYTNLGNWSIQVHAGSQIESKTILVEKYFQPLHEVFVSIPPYILATDETITTSVSGYYGTEKIVRGNTTVTLFGTIYTNSRNNNNRVLGSRQREYVMIDARTFWLVEEEELIWDMSRVRDMMGTLQNVELRLEAYVTEYFIDETRLGFAECRIITESLQLNFLQTAPLIFKPGAPFSSVLKISYEDGEKVPTEILEKSRLFIQPRATGYSGQTYDLKPIVIDPENHRLTLDVEEYSQNQYTNNELNGDYEEWERRQQPGNFLKYFLQSMRQTKYLEDGVVLVNFKVPKNTARLSIRAEYSDQLGNQVSTQVQAYLYHSPSHKYISIEKVGGPIAIGEFAIFRVTTNFQLSSFHYVVVAKGIIVQHGAQILDSSWDLPKTFSVPIASEMAPGFRTLVYYGTSSGEIVSDSVFIPVDNINRHKINMMLNQVKDKSKDTVELTFLGDPASYFGVNSQRTVRTAMQAGNDLTKARVLKQLFALEPWNRSLHKNIWKSRSGEEADQVTYFPSMNYGKDAYTTFEYANLIIFTDGEVPTSSDPDECDEEICLTGGCYKFSEKCDGIQNCDDFTDELDCDFSDEDLLAYRVKRTSRFMDFYDPDAGDWAWTQENIAHGGDYILTLEVPETTDSWFVNGFAMSKTNGFALIDAPIPYGTDRPFNMVLDAPSAIVRGEQVGVICMLYNKTPKEILAMVTLHDSPDYQFVHVGYEANFVFQGKHNIRFSHGDHQHLVWMPPESQLEVRFPIRPTVDQGTIEVLITATTQIRSDTESIEIEVQPEGVQIGKHTSLLLDLRNRALVLRFMNVWTEDTPEIPYEFIRKYIYGSTSGHVTVSGDVVGPIVSLLPVSTANLLGKDGKGTADRIFDLAANVWTLHYLRLTKQLESGVLRTVLAAMNKAFAHIMKRFTSEGSFQMWDTSNGSVWLTSHAVQIFIHSSFQDWENYFFVDQKIFQKSIEWLLTFQQLDGSFSETEYFIENPLNKKMGNLYNTPSGRNISLTAHLLITLHQVFPFLDGSFQLAANIARSRAMSYLEINLQEIHDPYSMAITAYAFFVADSTKKELAYSLLHGMRIESAEFIYWAPDVVPTNEETYENQRPFIQPKNNEFWDAMAVEATSYALLVYLIRDGVTPIPESIVTWLNTMRLTDGAFISSIDTIVALQALTEFANRARIREVTDLSVSIELGGEPDLEIDPVSFSSDDVTTTEEIEMSNIWGHVNIIGRGSGQAVVQLDTAYGIDWDDFKDTPVKDAFELTIREMFMDGRNRSILTIQACMRWILVEESNVSGTAVLEVQIPSGYGLLQTDAMNLASSGIHPTLKDALAVPGLTSWYFEYIPSYWTCFNHTVKRWYPVANLTTHRQATLYESYAPERFVNTMYNDTSLRTLDICHVCGSYQCPYCPFYSSAKSLTSSFTYIVIMCTSFFTIFVSVSQTVRVLDT